MLLNRVEYALMNNPVRAAIQRHVEAPQLLRMAGPMDGGTALEIGCGCGVGAEVILDLFGANAVHGFDLDPRMVTLARRRLRRRRKRTRVWVGNAIAISAPDATYDAVFDFGILHHVIDWPLAVAEVHRVLKPGGRFYAEETLAMMIRWTQPLLTHPRQDRFEASGFLSVLERTGFETVAAKAFARSFAWIVATRRAAA